MAAAETVDSQFDTLVVTGTRTEKTLLSTPVKTEVVSREDIETYHVRDAAEALALIPGVVLKPIHGKSGYEAWMQGFDSDRVKVLVDGQPVATSTGSTIDLTQISAADIERIEVVKGATSALYGSSAMGGVIQIFTRQPEEGWQAAGKLEGGSFGEDNLSGRTEDLAQRFYTLRLDGREERFSIKLHGDRRDNDGFDATPGSWSSQGPEGFRQNLGAALTWDAGPLGEYLIDVDRYDEDLQTRIQENAGGRLILKHKDEESERLRVTLGGDWSGESGEWQLRAFSERFENLTYQDVIVTPEKENRREAELGTDKANLDWSRWIGTTHQLSAGLEFTEETLSQSLNYVDEVPDGTDRQAIEGYLQDDIFLGSGWELVPGLRVQNDSDFGSHAAPKINARYDWQELGDTWQAYWRGGVGAGYRVPNLKERYYVFDHSHLGYMVIGSPDLEPESSISYQSGWGIHDAHGTHLELNLFWNEIDQLIETAFDEEATASRTDGVAIYSYVNVDRARTRGVELTGAWRFADGFFLQSGYTYTDSENKATGLALPDRPEHQLKTSLSWNSAHGTRVRLLHILQSHEYTDLENRRRSPSWQTFDLKVSQSLVEALTVYGGVQNLGDEQRNFEDPDDRRPVEGRFVYVGLQWQT